MCEFDDDICRSCGSGGAHDVPIGAGATTLDWLCHKHPWLRAMLQEKDREIEGLKAILEPKFTNLGKPHFISSTDCMGQPYTCWRVFGEYGGLALSGHGVTKEQAISDIKEQARLSKTRVMEED